MSSSSFEFHFEYAVLMAEHNSFTSISLQSLLAVSKSAIVDIAPKQGTENEFTDWPTQKSSIPVYLVLITGIPTAIASRAGMQKASPLLGITKQWHWDKREI